MAYNFSISDYTQFAELGQDAGTNTTFVYPSQSGASLGFGDLNKELAFHNINVNTGNAGSEPGNLSVTSAISSTSSNSLTLQAAGNISLANSISVSSLTLEAGTGQNVTESVDNAITGSTALTLDGTFTTTLSHANNYSGGTTVTGGATLVDAHSNLDSGLDAIGSGLLTLDGGTFVNSTGVQHFLGVSGVVIGSNGGTFSGDGVEVHSALTGSGKFTLSSTYETNADNSQFTGTISVVDGGTFQGFNHDYSFSPSSAFQIAQGGTVQLNSASATIASLANGADGSGGVISSFYSANVLTIAGAASTTFSGNISDGSGKLGLTLASAHTGTLSLLGDSSYSGGTALNGGNIELGHVDSAGTGPITFGVGAHQLTLDAAGTLQSTLAGFTASDKLDLTAQSSTAAASYNASTHQLTVGSGATADIINFDSSFTLASGTQFSVSNDGSGHALVSIGQTPALPPPVPYTITVNSDGGNDITLYNPAALTSAIGTSHIDNVYFTGASPVTLPDNIENIVLSGSGGGSAITGNALANIFTIKGGSWSIDGVSGPDAVDLGGNINAYTFTQTATGVTVTGAEGTEQLTHIPTIQFANGSVTFDTSHNAAEIFSIYQAAFGRQPDVAGETYWLNVLNGGTPETTIAAQFASSPEFASRYGADTSNQQYLTALYQNVLGRAPDSGGDAYWLGRLSAGETRAQLLIDFADSAENQAHVTPLVGQGVLVEHVGVGS